jgi:hypothetical protein
VEPKWEKSTCVNQLGEHKDEKVKSISAPSIWIGPLWPDFIHMKGFSPIGTGALVGAGSLLLYVEHNG